MFKIEKIKWKDIEGYEGLYKISNDGQIYSYRAKRNLKHSIDVGGYHRVGLSKNRKSKSYMVHRLVGFAFVDEYKNGYEINHKDADKDNNCDWNLEWTTHRENMAHVKDNRLNGSTLYCCLLGENDKILSIYHGLKICSEELDLEFGALMSSCSGASNDVEGKRLRYYDNENEDWIRTKFDKKNFEYSSSRRQIILCHQNGQIYPSQMEASRKLGVDQSKISRQLKGKIKDANGFTFELVSYGKGRKAENGRLEI